MTVNKSGSPLEVTRHRTLADYQQKVAEAPPVSKALLKHIESMFVPPDVSPGDPSIKEKLLFQHGIERVLKYIRSLHERQEKELQDRYAKE
jgi:hypothetical protein